MKKMFLVKNGKEVQMGDTIYSIATLKHPVFGDTEVGIQIHVTEEVLPDLVEKGIITVKDDGATDVDNSPIDLSYCVQQIADKLKCSYHDAEEFLNRVSAVYPSATLGILLREIAVKLDSKYDNHIENSPVIYVVSLLDGRITKVNKASIRSYRNFAAFRSIKDAKLACRIVRDILKSLFKNGQ